MEPFDQTKAAAFQTRMVDILNSSFLALAMSVGHHLDLFDTMAGRDWATSAETAAAAKLQERYVREWLAAMVVGRIVEYNGAGKYRLPPEHSAAISREAGLGNMASRMCFMGTSGRLRKTWLQCSARAAVCRTHDTRGFSISSRSQHRRVRCEPTQCDLASRGRLGGATPSGHRRARRWLWARPRN